MHHPAFESRWGFAKVICAIGYGTAHTIRGAGHGPGLRGTKHQTGKSDDNLIVVFWLVVSTLALATPQNIQESFWNVKSDLKKLMMKLLYVGFQKWGYPQIIHFRLRFSLINHPFWGTPIYGNPHLQVRAIEMRYTPRFMEYHHSYGMKYGSHRDHKPLKRDIQVVISIVYCPLCMYLIICMWMCVCRYIYIYI